MNFSWRRSNYDKILIEKRLGIYFKFRFFFSFKLISVADVCTEKKYALKLRTEYNGTEQYNVASIKSAFCENKEDRTNFVFVFVILINFLLENVKIMQRIIA